jgi:ADP-heptose:LPS heptosyltransferase
MASRAWTNLYVMAHAAPNVLLARQREKPSVVRRILITQHLLLGDTIMLTPLLKKARSKFPHADIFMTVPRSFAPIYEGRPYGVHAIAFDRRSLPDHYAMRRMRGFDLALVPGDNRWSWLARMLGARWVIAFAIEPRTYKEVPVDEFVRMPERPLAWGDIAACLLPGNDPEPFKPAEWPAPRFAAYAKPAAPYCVLHLGASSFHKQWPPERWIALIEWAEQKGYEVVLSVGPGEEALLAPVDREGTRSRLAGRLDLAQLWDLLRSAAFLVCPDTGIAHLARLTDTPTVAIYGPGSPISTGPGRFWASSPFRPLWDETVACRDQDTLLDRKLTWVRQCWRTVQECGDPVCIRRVELSGVIAAIEDVTAA